MSTQKPQSQFKFGRRARNLGLSALAAGAIGIYTLQQRSTSSAAGLAAHTPTPALSITPSATPTGLYQDGQYTGKSFPADRYGNVQIEAIITNGQLADFKILDYPYDRSTSRRISQIAIPYLMQEAVQAQNASIDLISGATYTSEAFIQSPQSALDTAAAAQVTLTPTVAAGSSL
jgi:uncharacterized protein with FMN-binding domain